MTDSETNTSNVEESQQQEVNSTSDDSVQNEQVAPVDKVVVLSPFKYHQKLRNNYKSRKKTWEWFSEQSKKEEQVKNFRSELLKNTYRLDKDAHKNLYEISQEVCEKLSIDAEVTLYQENNSVQLNAGISILDKEAHIVLAGN